MRAQLRQSPPVEEPPEGDEPVIDPAAEDAMWSYYLLWSAIARRAISDRRLLRQLGFLRSQRRRPRAAVAPGRPRCGMSRFPAASLDYTGRLGPSGRLARTHAFTRAGRSAESWLHTPMNLLWSMPPDMNILE